MSEIKVDVELKYCERCGNLGLRRKGCGDVYCEGCAREMRKVYRAERTGPAEAEGRKPCGTVRELEACGTDGTWGVR